MSILIFLIILLVLVIAHEFGHFFTAKKFGIRVDEFGFGFPPKLWGRKYGETEYTFNLLPFGGFVKIFGETPDEDSLNGPDAQRSFVNKPRWQQVLVLLAGVVANFLLAWILFSFGFMSGLPTSVGSELSKYPLRDVNLVVVTVANNSPAMQAGLKPGDKITSIKSGNAEVETINPETLKSFVVSHEDRVIEIGYVRGSDVGETEVTPKIENGVPIIGISMDEIGTAQLPVLVAFSEGMKLTLSIAKSTIVGLYSLVKEGLMGKGNMSSITGPVGLVSIVGEAAKFGFTYLMSFAALISINLAVINLIPFPALDGGRIFFLLIEKVKGSRINPKVANVANMAGFAILIILMLAVTYHDVAKLL